MITPEEQKDHDWHPVIYNSPKDITYNVSNF